MECKTAQLLFQLDWPVGKELPARDAADVEAHVAQCPNCSASLADRRWQQHLARAVQKVPLPDGLKQRLLHSLRDRTQSNLRLQRRRLFRYAGLAAGLLLVVGLSFYFLAQRPTTLQIEALKEELQLTSNGSDNAQRWFADKHNLQLQLPPQLDPTLLASCYMSTQQGKSVPVLLYVKKHPMFDTIQARVLVLPKKQFRVTLDEADSVSGGWKAELLPSDPASPVHYLVLFNSESLEDFFTPGPGTAAG